MFLDLTLNRNPSLIKTAFLLHQNGLIEPDTYVLDLDSIVNNAKIIKKEADKYGIKLYVMTKQFGRNPYVAQRIMEIGYEGAVAVDYREAEVLYRNNIKLGNVGHLVQIPSRMMQKMLMRNPEVVTVYSIEKAEEVSREAQKLGKVQKLILKVIDKDDIVYPGQAGGIQMEELIECTERILKLPNIMLYGLTAFPCFLIDEKSKTMKETKNMETLIKARELIEAKFRIKLQEINAPSMTCAESIKYMAERGCTHGEPGHALLGTTPLHPVSEQPEKPSIVYVSEISHNVGDMSCCYGGGYYRRSFMKQALVGKSMEFMKKVETEMQSESNIDYYIGLKGRADIGATAVFAFRTQIFVTRSRVAVVKGICSGNPKVVGIYDSQGRKIDDVH